MNTGAVQKMNTPREPEPDSPPTYITAIPASDMFADLDYQREPDMPRVRQIAANWDVRLVGVLEVSDRGEGTAPRYAVVDGYHRVRAAQLLDIVPPMVANVHTGLTVAQEAQLFDRLNRERRRLTTWDHWRARTAAGDPTVREIHKAVARLDLIIDDAPKPGHVRCTATLEKLHALGDTRLVSETLWLLKEAWGPHISSFDAALVFGVGLFVHHLRGQITAERLLEGLVKVDGQLVKNTARSRSNPINGSNMGKLVAVVVSDLYNREPGKKIPVTIGTFGKTARNAHSAAARTAAAKGGAA